MAELALTNLRHSSVSRNSELPLVSWEEFESEFNWRQGEHISLIGPTGQGKTTLGLELLSRREYVLAFGTKPRDETMMRLLQEPERFGKYYRVKQLPLHPVELAPRQLFWPKTETVDDVVKHRAKFRALLSQVYSEGGWTIFPDELRYICDGRYLGLSALMELLWLQGRSNRISVVGGFQRPAYVPLAAYDQPFHLFLWRNSDMANMRRLREIGGNTDPKELARHILSLDAENHETLYVNTRTGRIIRTKAEVK